MLHAMWNNLLRAQFTQQKTLRFGCKIAKLLKQLGNKIYLFFSIQYQYDLHYIDVHTYVFLFHIACLWYHWIDIICVLNWTKKTIQTVTRYLNAVNCLSKWLSSMYCKNACLSNLTKSVKIGYFWRFSPNKP